MYVRGRPNAVAILLGMGTVAVGALLSGESLWWARALLVLWTWLFFFYAGEADGHFRGYMEAAKTCLRCCKDSIFKDRV